MKNIIYFLPLLGILLLVSGGCSKRKEPKPLITEAPAVETEIGGYITETESSTPESQSVSGTIRLPIQEPEHQKRIQHRIRSCFCIYLYRKQWKFPCLSLCRRRYCHAGISDRCNG